MTLSQFIRESKEGNIQNMRTFILNKLNDCDEDTIKYIYNKVASKTTEGLLVEFLSTKFQLRGKPNMGIINDIIDHAVRFGDVEALTSMANSKALVSENVLLNGNNIFETIRELGYGFSNDFIAWLMTYCPKNKGKGVGNFELLLHLFVEGAQMADKGDIAINGVSYEIKGNDARLCGQGHWGNGRDVYDGFISGLMGYGSRKYGDKYRKAGVPLNVIAMQYDRQKDSGKIAKRQLYYKTSDTPFYNLIENIKSTNDEDYYDALLHSYARGLSRLYIDMKEDDIYKIIKDHDIFNKNGKVDYNKVINTCAAFDLYYYAIQEDFDYIGFFNTSGRYKIFDAKKIKSNFNNAYSIVSTYLTCGSPNTKPNSTAQDSFSQINVKK